MPSRRNDTTDRGDESEWSRRRAATLAKIERERADRGYTDAPLFAFEDQPSGAAEDIPAPVAAQVTTEAMVAEAEARLTLAWKCHEQMIQKGGPRQQIITSEQALIRDLHAYEQMADPDYYQQMQTEGKRP